MSSLLFERWNWERDEGEVKVPEAGIRPASFAEVLLDWRGLPYRVIVKNPPDFRSLDSMQDETFVYDYYYDDKGQVVEKRSLDEDGKIIVIVRYEYEGERKVAEVGWRTDAEHPPKRVRSRA